MTTLLAVGLGYCARHLLATTPHDFDRIIGTSRTPDGAARLAGTPGIGPVEAIAFDGTALPDVLAEAIAESDILLLSAPPVPDGDPLLALAEDALATSPRLSQVIYLTTLGVYGDHDGAWVDEETTPNPGSDRLRRRLAAEADWRAFGQRKDIPVAILRLAGIYGPGRNALRQIQAGEARRIDKPGQVFNRVHADDIAQSIRAVIQRGFDGILNVTDDLPTAPGEPVAHAAALLGVSPPPLLPFAEAAQQMSPMALTFWAGNKRVRNDRLKSLGVTLRHPTYREGLAAVLAEGEGR
ncbi:SDR family oxidoreductase [Aquabacter cavernae]|uniref:SDR family oxidoreductase n=1 Tax=Aquabacter cavernae TaxID=2496029 RepID=UPI000F8F6C3F|nr:SDR family oxidoreductase [Aquabacter cavernae]